MTKDQIIQIEEKNLRIEEAIVKTRASWSDLIGNLIPMIRELRTIAEAQVLMLSYRHQIIDKIAEMQLSLLKV